VRHTQTNLVGKSEAKEPLGRTGTDWRLILNKILKIELESVNWIYPDEDRI
jgi:hypothetical protein